MIEATNRSYLAAYRRNAKLMALMEQVAQIDEDFRVRGCAERARSPSATRTRSRSFSSAGSPTPSSTPDSRRRR